MVAHRFGVKAWIFPAIHFDEDPNSWILLERAHLCSYKKGRYEFMKALITGITGQHGFYLAEFCYQKDMKYTV